MSLIDDIRRDCDAGTPGEWIVKGHDPCSAYSGGRHIMSSGGFLDGLPHTRRENEANASRSARVPGMEQQILADADRIEALTAETERLQARVAALEEALRDIDALDPEHMLNGCSGDALRGLILRMGEVARAALKETGHD